VNNSLGNGGERERLKGEMSTENHLQERFCCGAGMNKEEEHKRRGLTRGGESYKSYVAGSGKTGGGDFYAIARGKCS